MKSEHLKQLITQYKALVDEIGENEAQQRITAMCIQCGKTSMVQSMLTGVVPEELQEPAMVECFPIYWQDTGEWEFCEDRADCPDEDVDPIEIPKDLLAAYKHAEEVLGDISSMIACAITDYVVAHPKTRLDTDVKRLVDRVHKRREKQED